MSAYYSENGDVRPLNDVVAEHLNGCEFCAIQRTKPPTPNLNPSGMGACSELQAIFQWYADYEGQVNNIVRHDEYGNEA